MAIKSVIRTQTIEFYDYHELADEVCEYLKKDIRDYRDSSSHFNAWCELTKKGQKDPEGKSRNNSQVWYSEYVDHPQGKILRPPYLDFWHWWFMLNGQIDRDSYQHDVNFTDSLSDLVNSESFMPDEEAWIVEILEAFIHVLGEDGNRDITLYYDW